ncbi:hypothetical protein Tdes44962_MAKER04579 [Teratosphaeria destructans]|uniref:Uncharacterized protein n=1 Tax=Teratosphaeria destructans TaxID=418781 RepID=A0A9W7W081_9PEZI|nr:hypothetical protein Tdes44962_MAKER04579 [Teratosphaeria destructans]
MQSAQPQQKVREQLNEYRRLKQQSPSSQHSHLPVGPGTPLMKQSRSAAGGSDGQDIFDFSVGQQDSLGADYFSIPIATPDATSPAPAQTSNSDMVNFGMSQGPPTLDDTASLAPVATLAEPTLPALSDDFIHDLLGTPPSPLPHADIPFSPCDDISNLLAGHNMPSKRQQSTGAPFAAGPARLDVELKFTDIILSVRSAGFANIDSSRSSGQIPSWQRAHHADRRSGSGILLYRFSTRVNSPLDPAEQPQ